MNTLRLLCALLLAGCASRTTPLPALSPDGVFVEPISASPLPKNEATNSGGIVGLVHAIDRQTAQRIATAWVDAVLGQNAEQLREAIDPAAANREGLIQRWLMRGRNQRGQSRDEVFDPATVRVMDHDAAASPEGAVSMTFEVKFDGAPMTRSYMPRPAQMTVRLVLVQSADGTTHIGNGSD